MIVWYQSNITRADAKKILITFACLSSVGAIVGLVVFLIHYFKPQVWDPYNLFSTFKMPDMTKVDAVELMVYKEAVQEYFWLLFAINRLKDFIDKRLKQMIKFSSYTGLPTPDIMNWKFGEIHRDFMGNYDCRFGEKYSVSIPESNEHVIKGLKRIDPCIRKLALTLPDTFWLKPSQKYLDAIKTVLNSIYRSNKKADEELLDKIRALQKETFDTFKHYLIDTEIKNIEEFLETQKKSQPEFTKEEVKFLKDFLTGLDEKILDTLERHIDTNLTTKKSMKAKDSLKSNTDKILEEKTDDASKSAYTKNSSTQNVAINKRRTPDLTRVPNPVVPHDYVASFLRHPSPVSNQKTLKKNSSDPDDSVLRLKQKNLDPNFNILALLRVDENFKNDELRFAGLMKKLQFPEYAHKLFSAKDTILTVQMGETVPITDRGLYRDTLEKIHKSLIESKNPLEKLFLSLLDFRYYEFDLNLSWVETDFDDQLENTLTKMKKMQNEVFSKPIKTLSDFPEALRKMSDLHRVQDKVTYMISMKQGIIEENFRRFCKYFRKIRRSSNHPQLSNLYSFKCLGHDSLFEVQIKPVSILKSVFYNLLDTNSCMDSRTKTLLSRLYLVEVHPIVDQLNDSLSRSGISTPEILSDRITCSHMDDAIYCVGGFVSLENLKKKTVGGAKITNGVLKFNNPLQKRNMEYSVAETKLHNKIYSTIVKYFKALIGGKYYDYVPGSVAKECKQKYKIELHTETHNETDEESSNNDVFIL